MSVIKDINVKSNNVEKKLDFVKFFFFLKKNLMDKNIVD